eukprot:scaffold133345_cov37-Tisochrysis_lutea.AAC.3
MPHKLIAGMLLAASFRTPSLTLHSDNTPPLACTRWGDGVGTSREGRLQLLPEEGAMRERRAREQVDWRNTCSKGTFDVCAFRPPVH